MTTKTCCGTTSETQTKSDTGYEIVRLEKTDKYCPLCDQYAEKHQAKPVVVLSCDGACLRGEVARQATVVALRAFLSLSHPPFTPP